MILDKFEKYLMEEIEKEKKIVKEAITDTTKYFGNGTISLHEKILNKYKELREV